MSPRMTDRPAIGQVLTVNGTAFRLTAIFAAGRSADATRIYRFIDPSGNTHDVNPHRRKEPHEFKPAPRRTPPSPD